MILEELKVPLVLDDSNYISGLERSMAKASAFGSFMGNIASNIVTGAFDLLGRGIDRVGDFMGDAREEASNLSESINAVNVVFEEGADIIHTYGKNAAEAVGLSNAKFHQLASVTGAFLTNLGFDAVAAADRTIELTNRAADMASVFNTDVDQALQAIQSGLKGEFNPLEQFGVKLNAATIEAHAMAMGLAETKKELTDNDKAQAALALIMDQTNKLAGDFTNTSDGLANGQRILAARFDDVKAKIGTAVLPVLEELQNRFLNLINSEKFQETLNTITTKLEELGKTIIEKLPEWEAKFLGWGTSVKSTYDDHLGPVITQLIRLWDNVNVILEKLDPSTEKVAGKFTLLGIAQRVAVGWATVVNGALTLVYHTLDLMSDILEQVAAKWDIITATVRAFLEVMTSVNGSIPSWLTPGSPTPLENGLRGINSALTDLNTKSLPSFSANMSGMGADASMAKGMDEARLVRLMVSAMQQANFGAAA